MYTIVYIIAGCGTDSIPIGMPVLIIYYCYFLLNLLLCPKVVTVCEVGFLFLFCVSSPNQIPISFVKTAIKS